MLYNPSYSTKKISRISLKTIQFSMKLQTYVHGVLLYYKVDSKYINKKHAPTNNQISLCIAYVSVNSKIKTSLVLLVRFTHVSPGIPFSYLGNLKLAQSVAVFIFIEQLRDGVSARFQNEAPVVEPTYLSWLVVVVSGYTLQTGL